MPPERPKSPRPQKPVPLMNGTGEISSDRTVEILPARDLPDEENHERNCGENLEEDHEDYEHHEEPGNTPAPRVKIGRADEIYNKAKRKTEYIKSKNVESKRRRFSKFVILVRTVWHRTKMIPMHKEIDIKGLRLQEALLEINADIKDFVLAPTEPTINKHVFFHSRDELYRKLDAALRSKKRDEDLIFELQAATQFLTEEYGTDMTSYQALYQQRAITFRLLWMIYAPNSLVVSKDEFRQDWVAIVRRTEYGQDWRTNVEYLEIFCDYIDHDGRELGFRDHIFKIEAFPNSTKLDALAHIPLQMHPEAEKLKITLLAQGKKALRFHGRHAIEYRGTALRKAEKQQPTYDRYGCIIPSKDFPLLRFGNQGKVILDPETWERTKPGEELVPLELQPVKINDLTQEQVMAVVPKMYGFSLSEKLWGVFACSNVEEIIWDKAAMDHLVLAEERKNLIHDLVLSHKHESDDFDDFIRGKGKGLIGLLAGPPGVGKTMTAEAISQVTSRPLYMVGSGELGDDTDGIHAKLKSILELAEIWNAVVLLDEADTFLSNRDSKDLKQNAITSIFLRELEYYQGILILTTNRVKTIDEAFLSRIHFYMEYPNLDDRGREEIWRNYLQRIKQNKLTILDIDDTGYQTLSKLPLNGREIRNVASISQAVANRRGTLITVDSITSIIKLSSGLLSL